MIKKRWEILVGGRRVETAVSVAVTNLFHGETVAAVLGKGNTGPES